MKEKDIKKALSGIVHPETKQDIVKSGIVDKINVDKDKINIALSFARPRDPFAHSIKKQAAAALAAAFPKLSTEDINISIKQTAPMAAKEQEKVTGTGSIGKIIAVASGKGGVGKSTVTANLAVTLRSMGYSVGVLDADIYGPSQPRMFGVENFRPEAVRREDQDWILPAFAHGVKLMSIGFFINADDALVWRGAMATNALKQLIHQTDWGTLDYLLIDLPPGTGDVHLTVIQEIKPDGALIVSTPQGIAVADVRRGVAMFRSEGIDVPVLGLIENMAWFTPAELPDNRYYIFGRGGASTLAAESGIEVLGEIPIIQSVMEGAEKGVPDVLENKTLEGYYQQTAKKIVEKLG